MEHIYQTQDVAKVYAQDKALQKVTTQFSKGQFVALLGPNGAGKSTLLKLLGLQELITEGDILFKGKSLKAFDNPCRALVAFVNEEVKLNLPISLQTWAEVYRNNHPRFDLALFNKLCEKLNIDSGKLFQALSRGQKMKALFCLEAAKRPEAYLIDEITSVLDVGSRFELMRFLSEERKQGALIVMSTNIGSEVESAATHVLFLEKGQPVLNCDKAELRTRFLKFRVIREEDIQELIKNQGRQIGINTDDSLSFLIKAEHAQGMQSKLETDRRAVTIEDVASYYTGGGE